MASKRLLTLSASVMKQISRADHQAATDLSMIYPRLGNRDIVGHGINGYPAYIDMAEYPAPPVRYKENTKEVLALREKEKGSWHDLTLLEKKELYRNSFRQTYVEMEAPTGNWKKVATIVSMAITGAMWFFYTLKTYILQDMPSTFTREHQVKQLERMVREGQGAITGVSSKWDYENNRWK